MTQIVLAAQGSMYPVRFRVYHTKKMKQEATGRIIDMPDERTFVTLTLWRDTSEGETVGDTVKRLKEMLGENNTAKYTIISALETDEERANRYKKDGLEVVSPKQTDINKLIDKAIAA